MWEMETFREVEVKAQGRGAVIGWGLCGSCFSLLDVKYVRSETHEGLDGTEP